MRALLRAAALLGWAVVLAAAIAGVSISAVSLFARTAAGRRIVAGTAIRFVDEALAGSLELQEIGVLPSGAVELRGLRVFDPDGHLVLEVGRARVSVDVRGARRRVLGIAAELESPSVMLEEERDGGVSLARAFAPSHPSPSGGGGGPSWTVDLSRLSVRGGELWWVDARGSTRAEARDLRVDARGTWSDERARAELRLRGALDAPIDAPIALDLVASRTGAEVRLPLLRAEIGGTILSALGVADLAKRTGRVAVTRLAIDRAEARRLEPRAPGGSDLAATAYAESDGKVATAAARVEPARAGAPGGRAEAAAATRVAAVGRALGLDVKLDRLDPSRVASFAPPGEITLAAHGALAGRTLADLRGRVWLALSRSRLRKGEVTRVELAAQADRGTIEVERLSAAAPGVAVGGSGRWREGGAVEGKLSADARDVEALARNAAALLGEKLPALSGRARIEASLAGTSARPEIEATVDAPALASGALSLGGVKLVARAAGPREGRIEGRAATLSSGARALARSLTLRASLAREEAALSATASAPGPGAEPLSLSARGRFGERRESVVLSELSLSYPGARFALAAPAVLVPAGPSVDRLELRSGEQRIALAGGVGAGGDLDGRVEVASLDLSRLAGLLAAPEDGVAGALSLDAHAGGTVRLPEIEGRFSISGGAFRSVSPVDVVGKAHLDGAAGRATAEVSLARRGGGTFDVAADLPLPLAGRPAERVAVRLRAADVEVEPIAEAAELEPPIAGSLGLDVSLEGSAGAPVLRGEATLDDARVGDLDGLSLWLRLDAPGDRLRVTAGGAHEDAGVLAVDAQAPLDLPEALARPSDALRALREAPLAATITLTGVDLARIAGRAGVPAGAAGILDAHAALAGSLSAPRGTAAVEIARGEWSGYRGLAARLDVDAGERIAASGRLSIGGGEALRLDASLGAPLERLGSAGAVRGAALRAEAVATGVALAPSGGGPLGGAIRGRLDVAGTPGAPEASLEATGTGVTVDGRPLGDLEVRARYSAARATSDVRLRPAAGGDLRASLAVLADLGLGAARGPLRDAPAEASVEGDLDLGALPALAPGIVRSAAGKLSLDVRAKGPLARMAPRGTLHVEGGTLAVAELGEWTGIAADASVSADAVEVSRLEVRRGKGRAGFRGSLRGLGSPRAVLDAHLESERFGVTRAGMDIATFDLRVDAGGSWDGKTLDVEARIPHGVVRLPNRTPRALQTLEARKDIVVGKGPERRRRGPAPAAGGAAGPAFALLVHAVAPRDLLVKSEDPKVDLELKADVRWEVSGSGQYAQGTVDVVRGSVAPLAGREFVVENGKVQFTGGPPAAAMLHVQARYDNPAAQITVTVTGPATDPKIGWSSRPSLDDASIAMLIATGRTDLQPGAGGVGTLSGEEAGKAALAAVATKAFNELVARKLPLDSVSVEPGALRAGKYVTEKIYVGYTRRLSADPQKGENEDEVRVEYRISPRWTFESRYGNAQSGGANLIWSKNF